MTTQIISSNTTLGAPISMSSAGTDVVIVRPDITLQNIAGSVVTSGVAAPGMRLSVAGEIFSTALAGSHAVAFAGGSSRIDVLAGGSIWQGGSAYAVSMVGGGDSLTNRGAITSDGDAGVLLNGGSLLENHGTIQGFGNGAVLAGGFSTVTNTGAIAGTGSAGGQGLNLTLTTANVTNSGSITATGGSPAVLFADADGSVVNSGMIGGAAVGIQVSGEGGGLAVNVSNSGTIAGWGASLKLGDGNDTVRNTGTLQGDVQLGDGDNFFDTIGGTVLGTVSGGGGNDVYRLSDASLVILEFAGSGTDRVESTVSYDLALAPNVEDLTLLGADNLNGTGSALANAINGNGGDNRLNGLADNDTLNGLSGDDFLIGGVGIDRLNGGDGDDRLRGGAGRDIMNGGADNDTFIYRLVSDSTAGASRDTIQDFIRGEDVIDLSAIDANTLVAGNQAFTFIGGAAFTAAGQVRYTTVAGVGNLFADVNGDGIADLQIDLTGAPAIGLADLIL